MRIEKDLSNKVESLQKQLEEERDRQQQMKCVWELEIQELKLKLALASATKVGTSGSEQGVQHLHRDILPISTENQSTPALNIFNIIPTNNMANDDFSQSHRDFCQHADYTIHNAGECSTKTSLESFFSPSEVLSVSSMSDIVNCKHDEDRLKLENEVIKLQTKVFSIFINLVIRNGDYEFR